MKQVAKRILEDLVRAAGLMIVILLAVNAFRENTTHVWPIVRALSGGLFYLLLVKPKTGSANRTASGA